MLTTKSEHIRFNEDNIEVDLLTNDFNNIGNTLGWAFPRSRVINGNRGETLLEDEDGIKYGLLIDFHTGVIYVSKMS